MKVKFGIKNVYYSVYTEGTGSEAGTYAAPVKLPGAVSLSLENDGDTSNFYADNVNYFTTSSSSGGSGSLETALADKAFRKAVLGEIEDSHGMLVEVANAVRPSFALLFEVATDEDPIRFVLYNCTANTPNLEANTTTDTTEPDTDTIEFAYASREFAYGTGSTIDATLGKLIKSSTNTEQYNAFYNAVLLPSPTA